jgi:DNA modification methylase
MAAHNRPQRPHSVASKNLQISYQPLFELHCSPRNARVHSEKQIQQIARSISAFGFNVPILVDADRMILAGHGRYLAAKLLGLRAVPIVVIDHLTGEQAAAFMLADNKLTENAAWDDRLLGEQLKILSEANLDFELEITGFEIGEIDCLIDGISPASNGKEDPADIVPESSARKVCQPGDLWRLGKHRILCGDARSQASFSSLMLHDRAAIVFADVPYNVPISGHAGGLGSVRHKNFRMASGEMSKAEFVDFLSQVFGLLARYSLDGSIHYICMDWRHMEEIMAAGKSTYADLENVCVWVKDAGGMGSFYRSQHEFVFVFKKGTGRHRNNVQLGQHGRYRTNVWQYPGMNSFARKTTEGNLLELHPTVKPVALVADAVMDCSKRGDIVLDPFLGSGTTLIAAERTGRVCHGMEIDPVYVDVAIRRWQAISGLSAVHDKSGQSFEELEQKVEDELRR